VNPNASGAASLVYSTYLGGSSSNYEGDGTGSDEGFGIAVDFQGNV
jgi:hypothetical protein